MDGVYFTPLMCVASRGWVEHVDVLCARHALVNLFSRGSESPKSGAMVDRDWTMLSRNVENFVKFLRTKQI